MGLLLLPGQCKIDKMFCHHLAKMCQYFTYLFIFQVKSKIPPKKAVDKIDIDMPATVFEEDDTSVITTSVVEIVIYLAFAITTLAVLRKLWTKVVSLSKKFVNRPVIDFGNIHEVPDDNSGEAIELGPIHSTPLDCDASRRPARMSDLPEPTLGIGADPVSENRLSLKEKITRFFSCSKSRSTIETQTDIDLNVTGMRPRTFIQQTPQLHFPTSLYVTDSGLGGGWEQTEVEKGVRNTEKVQMVTDL